MEKHDEIRRPIVRAGANGRSKWSPGKPRFDLRDYEPTEMHMSSNPTFAAAQPYREPTVIVEDQPQVKMTERRSLTSTTRPAQNEPVSERRADTPASSNRCRHRRAIEIAKVMHERGRNE
jgi:hypothetical protein